MRVIRTIRGHVIEAFNGSAETITPQLIDTILEPVYQNKLRIFDTTFSIEDTLERIISHYFFGDDASNKERAQKFSALVLGSDWCSFSSKRRLVMHIINETGALKGEAKNEYDKLLRDVMSARNAFAHGTVSTDGRQVKLAYFEGAPRTKFLDDEYLTQVETALNRCFQVTHDVAFLTGALKRHEA
ncbi:MAG TPA: hypothetical protein VIT21_11200 [Chthoniobacterales bacterium]